MPDETPPQVPQSRKATLRWLVMGVALILTSVTYLYIGDLLLRQTNYTDQDMLGGDQENNIRLALATAKDLSPDFSQGVSEPIKGLFPHRTDGVVNPLWPWVAAWMVDPGHVRKAGDPITDADRKLFEKGRRFHLGWTLGLVLIIGIAAARSVSPPAAVNVVLLVAFGAFLPRTAFFQPEPLFYALFLATWVACLLALDRNTLWINAIIGVFGGLAFLAKGSVQILLAAYVGISTCRWAWGWIEHKWSLSNPTSVWLRRNHWLGMMMLGFCFLMTAGPRMAYSARAFGDPFHSFPGYWMWFDSFEDGYAWMAKYNNKEALDSLPKSEKPSMGKYLREHSTEQVLTRLMDGTAAKLSEFFFARTTLRGTKEPKPWKGVLEWRGWYLATVALIFCGLIVILKFAAPKPANAAQRLHPEAASKALLVVGSFVVYSLAYGFYTPIGRGDRFMMSLYAPLVISLIWASESLLRRIRRRKAPEWIGTAYNAAHTLLAAAIVWRLIEIVRHPVFLND
ncbi:MAG: hypothetical protein JNJ83_15970 [Verrucomicrobiaceae bacterium]|nr:hypothetical protein [Verrucomicrobiaceae bacterium]